MTKKQVIEQAKKEIRTQIPKRVSAWIVKDGIQPNTVTVSAYSAWYRSPVITKEYQP